MGHYNPYTSNVAPKKGISYFAIDKKVKATLYQKLSFSERNSIHQEHYDVNLLSEEFY